MTDNVGIRQGERPRLERKRVRAAKRERERESAKVSALPESSLPAPLLKRDDRVVCSDCGTSFTSRKKLPKHSCASVKVSGIVPSASNRSAELVVHKKASVEAVHQQDDKSLDMLGPALPADPSVFQSIWLQKTSPDF